MRPGVLTRDGYLGRDHRKLADILAADSEALRRLGLTHADVAAKMAHLTTAGRRGLGTPVVVDGRLEVSVDEWRGVSVCPWEHKVAYRKGLATVRNLSTGEEMGWTEIQVHLVGEHGFYNGAGSAYRIDPAAAARVLEVKHKRPDHIPT
jgi:hypothetical protein